MPSNFAENEKVYYKQRNNYFYSPGSYLMSIVLGDLPWTLLQTFLFSIIFYWMIGLNDMDSGLRFFYFYLALTVFSVVMSNYVRVFGYAFADLNSAQGACSGLMILLVFFSGYLLPRGSIPPYFIWIHYLSPFKYVFEGLAINEFEGLDLEVGNITISGLRYISEAYSVEYSDPARFKWLALIILMGFTVLLLAISYYALHFLSFSSQGSQVLFHRSGTKNRHATCVLCCGRRRPSNDDEDNSAAVIVVASNVDDESGQRRLDCILTW